MTPAHPAAKYDRRLVRSPRGEQRREQILDAALRVFAEHGYEQASIEKVCAQASVARGTLYQYFADKQALFHAVLETWGERILAQMRPFRELDIELPRDPALLRRLMAERIHTIFATASDYRDAYALLLKEAAAKNAASERFAREFNRRFLVTMRTEIEDGMRLGLLRPCDAEFVANFILGALLKTAQEYLLDAERPADPGDLAARSAEIIGQILFLDPPAPRS